MSRPDGTSGAAPQKQLSSRLMTMKFMQRAAATKGADTGPRARASPGGTGVGTGPQTPGSERPSKRRRVEQTNSAASTPGVLSDAEQGSVATTERSSRVIYSQHGEETEWVLNVALPNGIARQADEEEDRDEDDEEEEEGEGEYADDDNDDADSIWPSAATGRQTYGSFQKKSDRRREHETKNEDDLSSVSGSLSDSEDDFRHSPAAKAGPGGQQPSPANGRSGGAHSKRDGNRNRKSSYGGGGSSWSPLTKLPNSKERRRQNRTSTQQRKHARKTL